MSVFLYKKAIKIESNFVKEKEKEESDDDDEKKKWTCSYAHTQNDDSKLTVSRVGKDAFVTVALLHIYLLSNLMNCYNSRTFFKHIKSAALCLILPWM